MIPENIVNDMKCGDLLQRIMGNCMRIVTVITVGIAFSYAAVVGCVTPGLAQSPCTDKSTPRECYEAGLADVGAALARLKLLEGKLSSIEERIKTLNDEVERQKTKLQGVLT